MKVGSMLKKSVVRILFFGIGFGLSYWITRPATHGESEKVTTPDPLRSSPKPQLTFPV